MVVLSKETLDRASRETLWDPKLERDACGVGFVTSIKGIPTNKVNFFYINKSVIIFFRS